MPSIRLYLPKRRRRYHLTRLREYKITKPGVKVAIYLFIAMLLLGPSLIGTAYAITNGVPDLDAHPYVGLIVFFPDEPVPGMPDWWSCTGFLISPTVMVCAGHCTFYPAEAWIWFAPGPITQVTPPEHITRNIHHHPDYTEYASPRLKDWISHDVGVIILPVPVDLDEYAALPDAYAIDMLSMKQDVDLVGYGFNVRARGGGPPVWLGGGTRFNASAQIIKSRHAMSDEFVRITQNPGQGKGGTSFGDSGGPALLAHTNIVLGVTSWGTNYNSAGIGYYARIDIPEILEWIRSFLQ